jgi:hypothetical protein
MISTSCILSTGEKKWMPMNWSGLSEAFASSVIGSVEVLVAKMQSAGDVLRTLRVTSALTAGVLEDASRSVAILSARGRSWG